MNWKELRKAKRKITEINSPTYTLLLWCLRFVCCATNFHVYSTATLSKCKWNSVIFHLMHHQLALVSQPAIASQPVRPSRGNGQPARESTSQSVTPQRHDGASQRIQTVIRVIFFLFRFEREIIKISRWRETTHEYINMKANKFA